MGSVRIIVLVVAAIAAIGLALVVRNMAAGRKAAPAPVAVVAPAPQKPTVQVLVARRDLPVGTRLAASDVSWQPWPEDSLNPSFITDGARPAKVQASATAKIGQVAQAAENALTGGGGAVQSLSGAIVREPFLQGEPLVERKIVRGGEGGYMSVVLQPGMRALAVPVTVETGAGGFILPGDRVDVMMSRKLDTNGGGAVGGGANGQTVSVATVMRNVRVLAIDQQIQVEKNAKSVVGATATLEIPAGDVEAVVRARTQGDLSLALRSYADMGGPAGRGETDATQTTAVRIIRAGRASEASTR